MFKKDIRQCVGGRGTARTGNALPEVIQEDSNKDRNITIHEGGLNPGGPKLLARQVHDSY